MKKTTKRILALLLSTLLVAISIVPTFAAEATCPGSASVHTTANCSYTEINVKAATCKTAGYILYACNICKAEFAVSTPKLTNHNYAENIVPATCETNGYITRYCSTCGDIVSTKLEKLGHDYRYTWADKEGELCKPGSVYEIRTCRTCGKFDKDGVIDGHTWVLMEVLSEPTCLATGLALYECSECGEEIESVIAAFGGHDAKMLGIITLPTCEDDGVARYFCKDCDKTFEAVYATKGHDFRPVEAQSQSCTTDLILATDQKCAECGVLADANGRIYEEDELEDRSATHTWGATTIEKYATCTTKGKEFRACSECGYEETIVTEALGHTEHINKGWVATCTAAGRTDEIVCVTCGEILKAAKELAVLDHVYLEIDKVWADGDVADISEPRCGESIKTTYKCKYCDLTKDTFTKLPDHNYAVEVTAPTCSDKGYSAYVCIYCNLENPEEERFNETAINPSNHTYPELGDGETIGDAASCTKAGREVVSCLNCGKGEHERVVPAFSHDFYEIKHEYMTDDELAANYGNYVTRVNGTGTCLVQSEYILLCKRCEDIDEKVTVKINDGTGKGHVKDTRINYAPAKAPTCTEPGNTESWSCTNVWCVNPHVASEIIPAIHTDLENSMKVIKEVEADCFTDGSVAYYICPLGKSCELYDKETKLSYMCDTTGTELSTDDLVVDKLEHKLVKVSEVEASCVSNGYSTYACTLCDAYIETSDFEAMLEHNYGAKSVMDSCENGRWQISMCKECGKVDAVQERAAGHVVMFNGIANELTSFCGDLNDSRVCTTCKTVILKDDHIYGNWILKESNLVRNCVACGAEDTEEHLTHAWVKINETNELITYNCICGAVKEEVIEIEVVETEPPATETEPSESETEPTETEDLETLPLNPDDTGDDKDNKFEINPITFIVMGGFILVGILIALIYLIAKRKKNTV